jgi:glycine/D-amino acid oxidase-like deaminating enzyme
MTDFVIVGQGLAGTALAWQLRWRGCRVLVLDREPAVTASRIAAGLITPVTGLRLVPSWRFTDLYPAAVDHYRRVERETGVPSFHRQPSIRIFQDAQERGLFEQKAHNALSGLVREPRTPLHSDDFDAPLGAFEMPDAARLMTTAYLDASRTAFRRSASYLTFDLDPVRDVVPTVDGVWIPALHFAARAIVFCQGHAENPWFPRVRFQSARGDVLTLRIPGLGEDRVVHRGIWLAPAGGDRFHAGSTFDRTALVNEPSPHGQDEIGSRLREFLRLPFEVLEHRAAVRPIINTGRPSLGRHAAHPGIAFFNGLGSKGALVAPYHAARLAESLVAGRPIEAEVAVPT